MNDLAYNVILIDPPWSYRNKVTGGSRISGSAAKYDVMSLEQIKALPMKSIMDKNCCVFMWVTNPMKMEASEVVSSWGLKYKTTFYWQKIMSLGMGYYFRGQIEELWVLTKGKVPAFRLQRKNWEKSKAGKHSEKPEWQYELIEDATKKMEKRLFLEMFARERRRIGWDVFGNEIDSDICLIDGKFSKVNR